MQSHIKNVKIPYRKGGADGSDQTKANGLTTKVFIPSMHELGHTHDYYAGKMPVDGACLAYFLQGDSDEAAALRKATLDGMPVAFWQRTQIHSIAAPRDWVNYTDESGSWDSAKVIVTRGIRPMLILDGSGLWLDDDGNLLDNRPPPAPAKLAVSSKRIRSTEKLTLSWDAVEDPDGDKVSYTLERSVNGGKFSLLIGGSTKTEYSISSHTAGKAQYRVKAKDSNGSESGYTVSPSVTVVQNNKPVINGDTATSEDFGTMSEGFVYRYIVEDPDGDAVTVTERIPVPISSSAFKYTAVREFPAKPGVEYELDMSGERFAVLTGNGRTYSPYITATDKYGASTSKMLRFKKETDYFVVSPVRPFPAEKMPRRARLEVERNISDGSTFKVEVCNNPYAPEPVWEDCTDAVEQGNVYVFVNDLDLSGKHGLDVRVTVGRAEDGDACWVSSISGNFEIYMEG
ncbi:hypothetical protein D1841_03670 [Neglecta sp. X4]|nr:hypothetical protein [Neglectibacter sp. 59]NBJ72436.1 hypothetical protein [Neglectibacter sp. X4]NCE80211.1 hypothetical protein [Neglectibacter sp. X58]